MIVSVFDNTHSRHPARVETTWAEVVESLAWFRPIEGDKDSRTTTLGLWSPVEYRPDATRGLQGVIAVHLLVLDYDDGVGPRDALDRWEGYERLVHTTWSHTPGNPRCRIVMPLAEPIPAKGWQQVYQAVIDLDGGHADPKCKDPSRMHYLPAIGAGGPHLSRVRHGELLDLSGVAERVAEQQKAAEALRKVKAAKARKAAAKVFTSYDDAERVAKKLLTVDPQKRAAFGESLGGKIVNTPGGEVVRRVKCPACGRSDVWWPLDPQGAGWAQCNHKNTCGWAGPLWALAA